MIEFLWVPALVAVAAVVGSLAGAAVVAMWVKVTDLLRARDARWVSASEVDEVAEARALAIVRRVAGKVLDEPHTEQAAAASEVTG